MRRFGLVAVMGAALASVGLTSAGTAQDSVPPQDIAAPAGAVVNDTPQIVPEPKPPIIPAEHFSETSWLQGARLSPEGDKIALQMQLEGEPNIVLMDAETRQPTGRFGVGEKLALEWFQFAGNDKILFSVSNPGIFYGFEVRFTRLYVVDLMTKQLTPIGRSESVIRGDDVIHVAEDGSHVLLSLQKTIYVSPSVWRIELHEGGAVEEIEDKLPGVWNWVADNTGVVRMGSGWSSKRLRVYYRAKPDDNLELIAKLKEDDQRERFWDVAQIVGGSNMGYVLEEDEAGRVGLRTYDYSKGEVVDTVYQHPDWDLESVTLRGGEPYAAFYTDDRDQVVWFDKEQEATYNRLKSSLNAEEIWITSTARDKSRMLVWAGGESDPGVLYVYTPGQSRVDELAELRPNLDFRQLATPKPVSYTARDGTTLRAYLTLPRGREAKNLPLILLPHGGPYGVRDKLQYNDEVQLLANRGYAVLQPNFRGSGGYGEAFSKLGTGQIGRGMQDDIDDAMDWAVGEGIADAGRVCVVGASYGGYAAIWAVIRNPERYRCAASWAGVTDWDLMLKYDQQFFSRKGGKRWRARVEGEEEDFDLDEVSPYRSAKTLSRPLLLAHGEDDSNVPFSQFRKMRNAANRADVPPDLLVIEDEGHSFSTPQNQKLWFDALTAFLAQHNPAE